METVNNDFVEKYAKKIMGFSYNKTQDICLAEDLAQEIMLQLVQSLNKNVDIDNMEAYISTVSKYTWSNFLKKNKKHWNHYAMEDIDAYLANESNVESEVVNNILIEKLKKEISYLCELHRKITTAFYFDNKTTKCIAEELHLNENTVRWHLAETRKELKMSMEVKEMHLDYEPVRMWCGHDGYCPDINMYGLANDLLVQNIIFACYGEPMSLSEIARKLNVSAAYLERHIEKMVEMDYLQCKKNKYQTTFYIETPMDLAKDFQFAFENIGTYAERILDVINKRMNEILDIKFLGYDNIHRDDIAWMTYSRVAQELCYTYLGECLNKKNIKCPMRSDGSRHWVCMGIYCEELPLDSDLKRFAEVGQTNGYRYSDEGDFADMIVSENYLNRTRAKRFRDIDQTLINNITKIYRLIQENREPDAFEKITIAELVKEGYVKVVEGKPQLTVMYLTKSENEKYFQIIEEIKQELGYDFFAEYMDQYKEVKMQNIPDFISKEAREYYSLERSAGMKSLGWIIYHHMLSVPEGDRALGVCTMLYEK